MGCSSAAVPVIGGYFEPGGMYGGHSGHHYWINYCPLCGHYNCLENNPKGTDEGELTCSICDSDYDGCTGADKNGGGARVWLNAASQAQITAWYHPQISNTTNTTNTTTNNTVVQPVAPQNKTLPNCLGLIGGTGLTINANVLNTIINSGNKLAII
jgi:hypothetical protein